MHGFYFLNVIIAEHLRIRIGFPAINSHSTVIIGMNPKAVCSLLFMLIVVLIVQILFRLILRCIVRSLAKVHFVEFCL